MGGAKDSLLNLLSLVKNYDKKKEIAVRNWGLRDERAKEILTKVDRTRVDYAVGLFQEMGFAEKEARFRAKLCYSSVLGT